MPRTRKPRRRSPKVDRIALRVRKPRDYDAVVQWVRDKYGFGHDSAAVGVILAAGCEAIGKEMSRVHIVEGEANGPRHP